MYGSPRLSERGSGEGKIVLKMAQLQRLWTWGIYFLFMQILRFSLQISSLCFCSCSFCSCFSCSFFFLEVAFRFWGIDLNVLTGIIGPTATPCPVQLKISSLAAFYEISGNIILFSNFSLGFVWSVRLISWQKINFVVFRNVFAGYAVKRLLSQRMNGSVVFSWPWSFYKTCVSLYFISKHHQATYSVIF